MFVAAKVRVAVGTAVFLMGAVQAAGQDSGLVAHWKLQGDVRDSSGHDNHGRNHGVQVSAEGARFDGRGSFIEVADSDSLDLGTRGLLKIKASQIRAEILGLAEAVRALKPRTILEIGTARGGTLLIWAQLASKQVLSCDLSIPPHRRGLYERFPPPGSSCRMVLLEGDSHEAAFQQRVRESLGGDPVDFLFIDGDHTEAGVTADWKAYRGLVRPGGLIAFHDILESQPFPDNQVARLWNRIRDEFRTEELVDDRGQCGFGIGLVWV